MRRSVLLLLAVLLVLSLAACTNPVEPEATPTPTPEPTPTPLPEVPDDHLAVYAAFLNESLVKSPYFSPYGDPAWAIVLGNTLTGVSEELVSDLYWCTEFALVDFDFDGVPELAINFGEVEKTMLVFGLREGKVALLFSCLSGNQELTDAVTLYKNASGAALWVSEGVTGTGGGSRYELGYIEDFVYTEQYAKISDTEGGAEYTLRGAKVAADAYESAVAAFTAEWTADARYDFSLIGIEGGANIMNALVKQLQALYPYYVYEG